MGDIIGIGGILATIIVGIITCVVTWIVAKRSQKVMKLSWSAEITKVLNINPEIGREKIQLLHDGVEIKNPHMMQIKIKNTGNAAIGLPVIMIKVDNSDKIISAGLNDVPYGYENKWSISVVSNKECKIELEHINPKQGFSVIIFTNGEVKNLNVSCPVKDVNIREVEVEDGKLLINDISSIEKLAIISIISCVCTAIITRILELI